MASDAKIRGIFTSHGEPQEGSTLLTCDHAGFHTKLITETEVTVVSVARRWVLLGLAGCPVHPLTGRYVVPSEPTMRRMAHDIDADAADRKLGAWLHAQAMAAAIGDSEGPGGQAGDLVAVAMDGKVIRNTMIVRRVRRREKPM